MHPQIRHRPPAPSPSAEHACSAPPVPWLRTSILIATTVALQGCQLLPSGVFSSPQYADDLPELHGQFAQAETSAYDAQHGVQYASFEQYASDHTVLPPGATNGYMSGNTFIPPRPSSTTTEDQQRTPWELTLEDAIETALQQNNELQVRRFDPPQSSWQIDTEESLFDPVFLAGGEWARSEEQIVNIANGPGTNVTAVSNDYFRQPQGLGDQLRLSKKLRTGGEIKAQFSSNYSFAQPDGDFLVLNPAIRSNLQFQLDHNLWQGVGRDINTIRVEIAHHVHSNAHRRLEMELRQTVLATASAYWALMGARENQEARKKGFDEAQAIWDLEIDKQKLGSSSGPDVAEARENLERFRVTYVESQQEVADAERNLRDLLGVPFEDNRFITPISEPTTHSPFLDWETSVVEAMHLRPEIHLQQSELEVAQLQKCEAADQLKPNLNGYAGWGLSGAGEHFDDTLEVIDGGDYATWWLGFRYEHRFGRRRVKALYEQAHLTVQQSAARRDQVVRTIHRELHDAYQSVENAWRVVEGSRQQLLAADEVLEARKEMHELGEADLEDKLRALAAWGRASSAERRALAEYNRALTEWEYARGSILEYTRIQFEPQPTPVTAP